MRVGHVNVSQISLEMVGEVQAEESGGLSPASLLGDGIVLPLHHVSCATHKFPTFFKLQLLPGNLARVSESRFLVISIKFRFDPTFSSKSLLPKAMPPHSRAHLHRDFPAKH